MNNCSSSFLRSLTKRVMLSEKKSHIGILEIKYLGMRISNGQIHPSPHLS
jgi:hypothetical protein